MRAIVLIVLVAISWATFAQTPPANSGAPAAARATAPQIPAIHAELPPNRQAVIAQGTQPETTYSPRQSLEQVQLAALADQNKMLKEFESSLLGTVWWALGVVVALALGLGGFSWFSTHKLYDSDKRALRDEFNQSIKEFQSKVDSALVLKLAENISSVDNLVRSALSETQTKIAAFKEEITELQSDVAYTHAEMRMAEFKIWETKGIPINMLVTLSQALDAITKTNRDWYVKHVFSVMQTVIDKYFINGSERLDDSVRERIKLRIEAAARLDEVRAAELLGLLAKIPAK